MAHEIRIKLAGLTDDDAENLFRVVQYALEGTGEYWRATNANVTVSYPDSSHRVIKV